MDSIGFVQSIRQKLEPVAPIILPGMIKKQLQEVGATEESLTPELTEEFIKRMEEALEMFLGAEGTKMAHKMMLKEFRKCAPKYFEDQALI
jgi:hypothetical protein